MRPIWKLQTAGKTIKLFSEDEFKIHDLLIQNLSSGLFWIGVGPKDSAAQPNTVVVGSGGSLSLKTHKEVWALVESDFDLEDLRVLVLN